MAKRFKRTDISGVGERVIVVAGSWVQTGNGYRRCYGVFRRDADVRAQDADARAIATLTPDKLSPVQRDDAEYNACIV